MRILLDTNILARSARGGTGPAAELLRHAVAQPHVLIVSPFLLSELARALRYPRLRAVHGLDDAGIDTYVQNIQSAAVVVNPSASRAASVVPHDPDDDPIVATAVAGSVEVLCTRDRDLRRPEVRAYCTQHGIRIMSEVELLMELRNFVPPTN